MPQKKNEALMTGVWLSGAALLLPALTARGAADQGADPEAEAPIHLGEGEQSLSGNGAPSGPHFNLNIIGTKTKTGVNVSGGGRIFLPLQGSTKVLLAEGAAFEVLDANGTDGSAQFQLPAADPDGDGVTN